MRRKWAGPGKKSPNRWRPPFPAGERSWFRRGRSSRRSPGRPGKKMPGSFPSPGAKRTVRFPSSIFRRTSDCPWPWPNAPGSTARRPRGESPRPNPISAIFGPGRWSRPPPAGRGISFRFSRRRARSRAIRRVSFEGRKAIALLNLRADRAFRTRRWLEALRDGFFAGFDRVVFIGEQAPALGRLKLPRSAGIPAIGALAGRSPAKVTNALWSMSAGEAVVTGVGNIAGLGGALVEYWDAAGTRIPC